MTPQAEAKQEVPAAQALPQLSRSRTVSTQRPEHMVPPVAQVQAPAAQVSPVAQAFPQAPQLRASVAVSTQMPLQTVLVPGQVGATSVTEGTSTAASAATA